MTGWHGFSSPAGDRRDSLDSGFSLIEVVLALGLASFVLVSILGLFGSGLKGVGESEARIEAANAAAGILSQRLAIPAGALPDSPLPALVLSNLPVASTNALESRVQVNSTGGLVPDGGRFGLTYRIWRDVSQSTNSRQVKVHLLLTWPAGASAGDAGNQYDLLTSIFLAP